MAPRIGCPRCAFSCADQPGDVWLRPCATHRTDGLAADVIDLRLDQLVGPGLLAHSAVRTVVFDDDHGSVPEEGHTILAVYPSFEHAGSPAHRLRVQAWMTP